MVTLKQIATEAGTTIATVSLALRGARNISAKRKSDIRRIADQLGYRRNAHVATLMRHIRQARELPQEATIAIVFTHTSPRAREECAFIDRRFRGMETRLAQRGYRPVTFWYNDPKCPPERLNHILVARGIRGIVLMLFNQTSISVNFDWSKFVFSTQSNFAIGPSIHRVAEDYFENIVTAMSRLWETGCRRIGLAFKAAHAPSAQFRITAAHRRFLEVATGSDKRIPPAYIPTTWNRKGFLEWFKNVKPDAILTFDWGDVPDWLRSEGIDIPAQVSVAALNYCPSAPELSGIDPEPEGLGATSVDLVIDQLENNEIGLPSNPKVLTVSGRWITGKTTRPPLPEILNIHPMLDSH